MYILQEKGRAIPRSGTGRHLLRSIRVQDSASLYIFCRNPSLNNYNCRAANDEKDIDKSQQLALLYQTAFFS